VQIPDVNYAWSGDVAIAYQELGEGPDYLVFMPFLANIYTLWHAPRFAPLAERLATGRRLLIVNPRGVGLSDRPRGFTVESRMDDIRVVMDDAGGERATLVGWAESSATCAYFAATYPSRVDRLILFDPSGGRFSGDRAAREDALRDAERDRDHWGTREYLERLATAINPQWAADREYLDWFIWHHRLTASPASWMEFRRMQIDLDITDVLPAIRVPTLVIAKQSRPDAAERVAAAIRGSEFVAVPGVGGAMQENDYAVEAIEAFLAGAPQHHIPDTVLATVLFTDVVGSTERAASMGDKAWAELLAAHHRVVREQLARYNGREMSTAGDGFFATFDGPARAIRCALACVAAVRSLGLEIRAGLHTGEIELRGSDVRGLAVHIGARIGALAGAGEVLVSRTVKDLVVGSGLVFRDHGTHVLKGVPDEWQVFAVEG
jgi:class 3 adenylate cyclase